MNLSDKQQKIIEAIARTALPTDTTVIFDWEDVDAARLNLAIQALDPARLPKALNWLHRRGTLRYGHSLHSFLHLTPSVSENLLQKLRVRPPKHHGAILCDLVDTIQSSFVTEPKVQKRLKENVGA